MLSDVRQILKCGTDNASKNDLKYLEKHLDK